MSYRRRRRRIDVDATLFQGCMPAGRFHINHAFSYMKQLYIVDYHKQLH